MDRIPGYDVLDIEHLTNFPSGNYEHYTPCGHVVLKTYFNLASPPSKFLQDTEWNDYLDPRACPTCEVAERRAAATAAGRPLDGPYVHNDNLITTTLNETCRHIEWRDGPRPNCDPQFIRSLNLIAAENNPGLCGDCIRLEHRYPRRNATEIGPIEDLGMFLTAPDEVVALPPGTSRSPSPAVSERTVEADHEQSFSDMDVDSEPALADELANNVLTNPPNDQNAAGSSEATGILVDDSDEEGGEGGEGGEDEQDVEDEEEDDDTDYYTIGSGSTGVRGGFTYPVWGRDAKGHLGDRWYLQVPGSHASYSKYHDMVIMHKKEHSDVPLPFPMAKKPLRTAAFARDALLRANNEGGVAI